MTKNKSKRLLSLLLTLVMVFTLTITPMFAANLNASEAVEASESVDETIQTLAEANEAEEVAEEADETGEATEETTGVAKIGSAGYDTLASAFAAATSGDTITLTGDLAVTDGVYSANGLYQVSTNVTLDLNDHTLTVNTTRVFGVLNGGSLTVKNGTVKIADGATATGNQFNILRGTCSFTAENVTFDGNNIAANFLHVASGGTAMIALTNCDITNQNGGVVVYDSDGNSAVTLTGCNYEKNPGGGALNDIANFKIIFNSNNQITSESTNWEAGNSLRYTYVVADGGSVEADLTLATTRGAASLTVEGGSVTGTVKVADGTSMTVSGGTVTGTVTTYGTFTMTGGTITTSGSSQAVLVKSGTVNISGGTICASSSRGLVFDTDAAVSGTISGGTFIGNDIALLARSSSDNTVKVTGGTYTASKGIDLVASILADGYIVYDTAGNAATVSGNYYMSSLEDATVVVSAPYVAQIGNTYYTSLSDAVTAATSGDTVLLLDDVELDSYLTVGSSVNVTLDLNGKTISQSGDFSGNYLIYVSGILTIQDSTGNGGTISVSNTYGIVVTGSTASLTVENGTITNSSGRAIQAQTSAALTVNGGTLTGSTYGVYATGSGSVSITGGTVSGGNLGIYASANVVTISGESTVIKSTTNASSCYGLYAANGANVTVNSGTITGYHAGVCMYGVTSGTTETKLIVNGGSISSTSTTQSYGIITNNTYCTVTVNGGKISGYNGIFISATNSKLTITDGEIYGDPFAIYVKVASTTEISGGTITGGTVSGGASIALVSSSAVLNVTDGEITRENTAANSQTLYVASGTANISGGEFSGNGYVLYASGSSSVINMSGGSVTSGKAGVWVTNGGKATISGSANISGVPYGAYSKTSASTLTVTGGTIDAKTYGIYAENGTVSVSGESTAIEGRGTGTTYVSGYGYVGYGIYVPSDATSTVNVTVADATVTGKTSGICLNSSYAKLTVNSGTITGTDQYGILLYNTASTATVNGGEITGGRIGICSAGTTTITGGTIIGQINAPDEYKVNTAIYGYTAASDSEAYVRGAFVISGGHFSSAVDEEYCEDGYVPYTETSGDYVTAGVPYTRLLPLESTALQPLFPHP